MSDFNLCILSGRLTNDPTTKTLPSGTSVLEFGFASNYEYKKKGGEKVSECCFIDCVCFGPIGQTIAQYCCKGKPLLIQGKHSKHEMTIDGFRFLPSPERAKSEPEQAPAEEPPPF